MVQNTKATIKTYSTRSMADFKARILECHFGGMYLDVDGREVGVQFIGKFNVSNLLAVYGTAIMLGKKPEDVLVVLSTLHSVNGRLEPIQSPEGYTAIVDYAHTPDALENVLNAIHEVLNGKGEVITVCGAGGNRDKGKRQSPLRGATGHHQRHVGWSERAADEESHQHRRPQRGHPHSMHDGKEGRCDSGGRQRPRGLPGNQGRETPLRRQGSDSRHLRY